MPSLKCPSSLLCLLSWTHRFFVVSGNSKLSCLSSHTNTNPKKHNLLSSKFTRKYGVAAAQAASSNSTPISSGLEEVFTGYIFGKKRSTEVAHQVWKHVVRKGDTVIDATCGNGFDTLAMLKLVTDESRTGRVYGMDIQKEALESTSSLLDESVDLDKKELVKLYPICHSRMEEIVPDGTFVRLVAFNLGYLPGGDKTITTVSGSTVLALVASAKILESGGLISILVYVGHPGGREEYEAVQGFASGLSVESWVCCKLEMLNRPLAPVLIFIFKR